MVKHRSTAYWLSLGSQLPTLWFLSLDTHIVALYAEIRIAPEKKQQQKTINHAI